MAWLTQLLSQAASGRRRRLGGRRIEDGQQHRQHADVPEASAGCGTVRRAEGHSGSRSSASERESDRRGSCGAASCSNRSSRLAAQGPARSARPMTLSRGGRRPRSSPRPSRAKHLAGDDATAVVRHQGIRGRPGTPRGTWSSSGWPPRVATWRVEVEVQGPRDVEQRLDLAPFPRRSSARHAGPSSVGKTQNGFDQNSRPRRCRGRAPRIPRTLFAGGQQQATGPSCFPSWRKPVRRISPGRPRPGKHDVEDVIRCRSGDTCAA